MNHKSKPKSKSKRSQIDPKNNSQTIAELMQKARKAQLQRQQLIKAKSNIELLCEESTVLQPKKCENITHQQQQPVKNNLQKDKRCKEIQLQKPNNNPPNVQLLPPQQLNSIQNSFRPFESNRTLEPYLINIKQEYVCSSTVNKPEPSKNQYPANHKQFLLNQKYENQTKCPKNQSLQPVSNTESIQLSSSRQVSQEMLLHNSVTSKFLQSPTLSLGLVQSKITKKQADSQNNSKVMRKKQLKSHDSDEQILFVHDLNRDNGHKCNEDNKRSIRFYQELIKSYQQHQQQQTMRKKQLKDIGQQFPENSKIEDFKENLKAKIIEAKTPLLMDSQFNNSIMASYQMQVEYLRKINLYQSFQIQKLRQLIRNNQNKHQRSVSMNAKMNHQSTEANHDKPSTKTQFKKAIDIIKRRQTLNHNKRYTQPIQQVDFNAKNLSTENTDLQFICGDYISNFNNKRSVSFTTNNFTNSDTFHYKKKPSIVDKKNLKSKARRKALSISDKHNLSYNYESQIQALNPKSQSLNMTTQQMMNLSMQKHNLSCSTYFMGTKSTKKSAKCKTTHSQRNLSTIVSSSNKENNAPRQFVKHQNKKMAKKNSILAKDLKMFVGKKHSQQLMARKRK